MGSIKPQTPIINWGNPITKRMTFSLLMSENAGTKLIDGVRNAAYTFQDNPAWVKTPIGSGLNFNGTSNWVGSSISPIKSSTLDGNGDVTVMVYANPSAATLSVDLIAQRTSNQGAIRMIAGADSSANNLASSMCFLINDNASLAPIATGAGGIDGNWHQWVMRRTGSLMELLRDGVVVGTGSPTKRQFYVSGTFALGRAGDLSAAFYDKSLGFAYGWDRALSNIEISQLLINPFQIFYQPTSNQIRSSAPTPTPPTPSNRNARTNLLLFNDDNYLFG